MRLAIALDQSTVSSPVDVLIKSDPLAAVGRFFSFNGPANEGH